MSSLLDFYFGVAETQILISPSRYMVVVFEPIVYTRIMLSRVFHWLIFTALYFVRYRSDFIMYRCYFKCNRKILYRVSFCSKILAEIDWIVLNNTMPFSFFNLGYNLILSFQKKRMRWIFGWWQKREWKVLRFYLYSYVFFVSGLLKL